VTNQPEHELLFHNDQVDRQSGCPTLQYNTYCRAKYIKPDRYMFKQLKISLVVCHSFKINRMAFEQDG